MPSSSEPAPGLLGSLLGAIAGGAVALASVLEFGDHRKEGNNLAAFGDVLAGLGGVLFALDVNSVQPAMHGNFYELYAIAASS